MGNTTVDPMKPGIGCSIITVENRVKTKENGPKFSVQNGEDTLSIKLSSEKVMLNKNGEIVRPDGSKTGSTMSTEQKAQYDRYIKGIEKIKESQKLNPSKSKIAKGLEH